MGTGTAAGWTVVGATVVRLVDVGLLLGLPGDTGGPGVDGLCVALPSEERPKDGVACVGPALGPPEITVG